MSTNAYTEYEYKDIGYYYPVDFTNRNKDYLLNQYRPSFTWCYGDPIHLEFYLDELGNVGNIGWLPINNTAQLGTIFSDTFSATPFMNIIDSVDEIRVRVLVEFYNNRFEKIYSIDEVTSNILCIDINEELSKKLFYKGIFYCSIRLLDNNGSIIRTILSSDGCSLYVN